MIFYNIKNSNTEYHASQSWSQAWTISCSPCNQQFPWSLWVWTRLMKIKLLAETCMPGVSNNLFSFVFPAVNPLRRSDGRTAVGLNVGRRGARHALRHFLTSDNRPEPHQCWYVIGPGRQGHGCKLFQAFLLLRFSL